MAYRQEAFANDEYYHVFNRGVEGRDTFMDDTDRKRFLESLKEFNTSASVTIQGVRKRQIDVPPPSVDRGGTSISSEKLVDILCFCLLPNHFHLLLKQRIEGGITAFMRKLGTGYTYYFNTRQKRLGYLFQGAFKAVRISKEAQFLHISRYIHLNVLDSVFPEWREGKMGDWEQARRSLESYPWSSYPIYTGKQYSDFCAPGVLGQIFKNPQEYEEFLKGWTLRSHVELQGFTLE